MKRLLSVILVSTALLLSGCMQSSESNSQLYGQESVTEQNDTSRMVNYGEDGHPVDEPQSDFGRSFQTIQEIRAAASDRNSLTFSNSEKIIDVPLLIPQVETVPVVRLKYISFDLENIRSRLTEAGINGIAISTYDNADCNLVVRGITNNMQPFISIDNQSLVYIPVSNGVASNSTTTPDEPLALMKNFVSVIGLTDVDVELSGQYATTGGFLINNNNSYVDEKHASSHKPHTGYEQGYYSMLGYQKIQGIKVFASYYFAILNDGEAQEPLTDITISPFFDYTNYQLQLRALQETDILSKNVELYSLEKIAETVQNLLDAGKIKYLHSIELGYMLYYEKETNVRDNIADASILAIPTWNIMGQFVSDPSEDYLPLRAMDRQLLGSSNSEGGCSLRIDALNGEIIDSYQNPAPRKYQRTIPK